MITVTSHQLNRSEGIEKSISHHIKAENLHLIFGILRKSLYSDPILATIREIAANAKDAHVMVDKPNLPIRVTLPTSLDSFFTVRDFGPGLSDEDIQNLYSGYGDSGKRHTNTQIGGFGIGKMSPLSYTDSFIVTSYQNGIMTSWNNYIDTSEQGKIVKMGSAPTNEPNGVAIQVPVKNCDINVFHQKSIALFCWWDVTPELIHSTSDDTYTLTEFKNRKPILEGTGYKFYGNRESKVIMGGIPYAISSSVFTNDELQDVAKAALDEGIILYAEIGELEVAASREQLGYSPATKKKLAAILNGLVKDLIQRGNDTFKSCKTLWEAKVLYHNAFSSSGSLHNLRQFMQKTIVWNGQRIDGVFFRNQSAMNGEADVDLYAKHYGQKIKRTEGQFVEANERYIVLENDLGISNGIIPRIIGLLEEPYTNPSGAAAPAKRVYIVKFKDAAAKAKWLAETQFDGPIQLLSTRPKELLTTYYGSNANGSGYTKNAKHQTKEFILDLKSGGNYRSKCSDFFEPCDVDVENDAGVYVLIDGFYCQDKGSVHYFNEHPTSLIEVLKRIETITGAKVPTIYAFKIKHLGKVKENLLMVNVWDWMQEQVTTYFNDVTEQTKMANWLHIKSATRDCAGIEHLYNLTSMKIDKQGQLAEFFDKASVLFEKDKDENCIFEAKNTLAAAHGILVAKFKANIDIVTEFKKVHAKYPLLFFVMSQIGYDSREISKQKKHLEHYINLIDNETLPVLNSVTGV